MAKEPKKPPQEEIEPTVLEEPGVGEGAEADANIAEGENNNVWMRGLWMLVLAILFGFGELILGLAAVLQFLWLLFAKEKNQPIAEFGKDLADWLARVAMFQTATTEDKPFPFTKWGKAD
jgi:hypothetical protein